MAFPSSPSVGDTHSIGTQVYEWNGYAWDVAGSTTASAITDKADITYVDTSINNLNLSGISAITSNVLMSGNLALANYAVTKNFATVTYTGNGGTQSINTGISSVDFTVSGNGSGYWLDRSTNQVKNDAGTVQASGSCVCNVSKVHFKTRSIINNHMTFDGIRGRSRRIYNNLTNIEDTNTECISSFTSTGFNIGATTANNQSGATYVAYQTLYTHIKWGTTNQGKFYVEAYNPVTREGMIYYIGSGIAGHEIPHSQGVELDWQVIKGLNGIATPRWVARTSFFADNENLWLELANAKMGSELIDTNISSDRIRLDGSSSYINNAGSEFITYYKCKSETWTIVPYQGSGASGNFIETKDVYGVARKPARIVVKAVSSTGSWLVYDNKRNVGDEFDRPIILNTYGVEGSGWSPDYISVQSNGFTMGSTLTSGDYSSNNISGVTYIALVEFDTNGNGGDSYFDLPTDDSNLNVTAGTFTYTNGIGSNGYERSTEAYTGAIDFAGMSDGRKWIAKTEGGSFVAYDKKPMTQMNGDGFSPIFDTKTGKIYTDYALFTDNFNDTSAWIANNATLSIVDGKLKVYDNGSTAGAKKTFTTIAGKKYKVVTYGVPGNANCQIGLNNGSLGVWQSSFTGYKEAVLTAATTSIDIYLQNAGGASDTYALFEYFSIIPLNNDGTVDVSNATPVSTPVSFLPNPIMVASETPMDIRYDDVLSQNVAESVEANKMTANEFSGKNACTAWVNFDGTTTPPTIKDSYNVDYVVSTATGHYDVYFSEDMDNINYCTALGNQNYNTNLALSNPDNLLHKVQVRNRRLDATVVDSTAFSLNVQIFGGKN